MARFAAAESPAFRTLPYDTPSATVFSEPGTFTRFGGRPSTDARACITAGVRVTLGKLYSLR